jgi:hypothetical protein
MISPQIATTNSAPAESRIFLSRLCERPRWKYLFLRVPGRFYGVYEMGK